MTAQTNPYFDLSVAPHSIEHVEMLVRNLDKMTAFYTRALGLKIHDQASDRVQLGTENDILLDLVSSPDVQRRNFRSSGLFHVAYLLPTREDLGAWYRHSIQRNLSLDGAAHHGVSEAFYLSDPEGNGVEVYADRPRREWRSESSEVNITTRPMKTATLPNGTWAGMGERGRIGHVHLQANDLAASEAFWTGMGFDVSAQGNGATFFGSGGYHHQIATNTWNSAGGSVRESKEAGLSSITMRSSKGAAKEIITPSGIKLKMRK